MTQPGPFNSHPIGKGAQVQGRVPLAPNQGMVPSEPHISPEVPGSSGYPVQLDTLYTASPLATGQEMLSQVPGEPAGSDGYEGASTGDPIGPNLYHCTGYAPNPNAYQASNGPGSRGVPPTDSHHPRQSSGVPEVSSIHALPPHPVPHLGLDLLS